MKNLILFAIPFLMLISSCGKDDDSSMVPSETLTAKINGQDYSSAVVQSQINEVFISQVFTIAGAAEATTGTTEKLALTFFLPLTELVEEMKYAYTGDTCNGNQDVCGFISYGVTDADGELDQSSANGNGNATIEFSSLVYTSGGNAVGTFSGILFNDTGEEIIVTDGKFNVSIQ